MNEFVRFKGFICVLTFFSIFADAQGAAEAQTKIEPQILKSLNKASRVRVIIQTRPDASLIGGGSSSASPAAYVTAILGSGASKIARIGGLLAVSAEVTRGAVDQLGEDPNVVRVTQDVAVPPALMDSVEIVGAGAHHRAGHKGAQTAVAVLDTGINDQHPALSGAITAQACFSSISENPKSTTLCPNGHDVSLLSNAASGCVGELGCEHGTHVAGIIAGRLATFDNRQFTGIAPGANIVAIQVFSLVEDDACAPQNKCLLSFTSDQLRALDWVYRHRATYKIAAVNMSLGGGFFEEPCDLTSPLTEYIERLKAKGIPTVIAAGNSRYYEAISEPACISHAVAVSALNKSGSLDTSYTNVSKYVRFAAPGTAIVSAVSGTGFAALNGTSMAAPHVAGAFALLRQEFPNESLKVLERKLQRESKVVIDPRTDTKVNILQLSSPTEAVSSTGSSEIVVGPSAIGSLVAQGSLIVLPARPGADVKGEIQSQCQSESETRCQIKQISPDAWKVDVQSTSNDTRKAAAGTSQTIEKLKSIESLKSFDNRLSKPLPLLESSERK
ncbi:MAG: S8 family serine peptidase [Pseudolabrys sp.]|nr:S8 family serine peptidase [Pseudolabrys sp.]